MEVRMEEIEDLAAWMANDLTREELVVPVPPEVLDSTQVPRGLVLLAAEREGSGWVVYYVTTAP